MSRTAQPGKTFDWPQVGTFFDQRSPVDQVGWGRWRYVLNMRQDDRYGWGRRCGFVRLGSDMRVPGNADLKTRDDDTDITSLYSHVAPAGFRRLFAATAETIYSQHFDGRWRVLGDFAAGQRFQFAGVNNVVLATNNKDVVKYHILDEALDADGQAFHSIASLSEIGLSTAGSVVAWKGVAFLLDVVMDGVHAAHRVVWSDSNAPLSFAPSDSSIAGFQDLDPGETILTGVVLGDALFLFTTQSIWRVTSIGGDEAFGFQQVYKNADGEGCLRGRNCIAVVNGAAVYMGNDSLYVFAPFSAQPEKPEWLFRTTKRLVTQSDMTRCSQWSAVYHPVTEEFWVSYVEPEQGRATRTLSVNFRSQVADEIDHGFTAMLSAPLDTRLTLYEWMEETAGCSSASISALWPATRTDAYPTVSGESLDLDTICAYEDFVPDCPQCQAESRLVLASGEDRCLKQQDLDTFGREIWDGEAYTMNGYGSRFTTGAINFGTLDWKRLSEIAVGFIAPATDTPRNLTLRVGVSSVPADLLETSTCFQKIFTLSSRALACPSTAATGMLPNAHHRWPVLIEGRYIALDFQVAAATGGSFWLSRLTASVGKSPNTST